MVGDQNRKRKGNTLQEKFKVRLLNGGSGQWLYETRNGRLFKHYEENTGVEHEWGNIKIYST